jgi:alpha-tubulin suppressor-like RCC1 family protein
MNQDKILCIGSNFCGQLGIGDKNRDMPPYCPVPFGQLQENLIEMKDIQDIQCGSQFTVVLATSGALSICGALNGATMPTLNPVEIMYPMRCIQISCGRKHILALLDGGFVASWGTGYFGQLGHGDDSSWDTPRMINMLEPSYTGSKVIQIVCGGSHSGALTERGQVFMWGLNRNGQCGVSDKAGDSIQEPKPVDMSRLEGEQATSVVCGRNHSAMVTAEGRVYCWGAASFGRLGHADAKKKQSVPLAVPFFSTIPVHSLSSGDFHMLALGHNCAVYSWGYGAEGQCGHGNTFHLRTPRQIDFFNSLSVVRLACGASWSMAITKSGDLYGWGYNDGGWIGVQPKKRMPLVEPEPQHHPVAPSNRGHCQSFDSAHNVLEPKRVKLLSNRLVEKVRCGSGHSIVFTSYRARTSSGGLSDDSGSEDEEEAKTCERLYGHASEGKATSPNSSRSSPSLNKDGFGFDDAPASSSLCSDDPAVLNKHVIGWCRHKKIAELSYALAKGASLDMRDDFGNTPLIVACQNGHSSVCHLLVEHGANLRLSNDKGNTALHYCFAYHFEDLGKFLISQGADEYAVNTDGLTCYEGLSLADVEHL